MENQEKKEVDNNKSEVPNWTFQYIASVSASLATFSSGIVFGWPSQITDNLLDGELDFPITSDDLGWICSCSSVGAACLTLFIGPLCDRIGRKTTMLLLILVFEIGWLLMIFSTDVWMLILGRFFTGMAGGSYCVTVSLYIGEIAQKEIRGVLGGLTQFTISCGILFANIVGSYLSVRRFSIVCAILPLFFGVVFVNMPETPIHLLQKGKVDESEASLRRLLGKNYIEEEYMELRKHIKSDSKQLSTREVLKKRSVKKACIIGIGLAFLKVLTGIDAVTSYLSHIFNEAGFKLSPNVASMVFATTQVLSMVPQTFLVDKLGRKILLVTAQILMGVCLTFTACSFIIKTESSILDYLPMVALCLFTAGFSIGIGPIGWIITAEIFEEKIKGRAMSICTFLIWLLAFVNVKMFGILEDQWNISVPLFIFAVTTLLGALFIWILVPETKNRSFEEIEKKLSR